MREATLEINFQPSISLSSSNEPFHSHFPARLCPNHSKLVPPEIDQIDFGLSAHCVQAGVIVAAHSGEFGEKKKRSPPKFVLPVGRDSKMGVTDRLLKLFGGVPDSEPWPNERKVLAKLS